MAGSRLLVPGLQVKHSTVIRKIRELPVSGELLVKIGDEVSPDTVVAKAELPGDLYILRIPEKMGIEPFEVFRGLRVKEGDTVSKGDLLCEHAGLFGLFRSRFLAPYGGVVEFITERTGHLGLRLPSKPLTLSAYIEGRVVDTVSKRSATIEASCAFAQGIFGVGGERIGKLRGIGVSPDAEVTENDIPDGISGSVLFGGASITYNALRRAASAGSVGIITGSIDDQALADFLGYDIGIALTGDEDISMTLIVTEGFGHITMAERVIKLLNAYEGSMASINGATQVRAGALRPEIIIHRGQSSPEKVADTLGEGLRVGSRIRVIRFPYFGVVAEVTELPSKIERIQTGAETRVLRARTESGDMITVPRANVELFL